MSNNKTKGVNLMKKVFRSFKYGEKGFTLIELLVVIAILGVLAAIAVPNVGKFMNKGHTEAARTELHNVQTAVLAGMADAGVGTITGGTLSATAPPLYIVASNQTVGKYIVGGFTSIQGTYSVGTDGSVTQTAYPGVIP